MNTRTQFTLTSPIEATLISVDGAPEVAMCDFRAGEVIEIEQQAPPRVFGWEGQWIANRKERGWSVETQTVFWVDQRDSERGPFRYTTFDLPEFESAGG
jgi:hypothetical protein